MSFRWEWNFILFDKIPVSTIKLLQIQFQAFRNVSLFEKLIWKSLRPQNKTSIRGASPGMLFFCYPGTENLWYGNWNRHVCHKRKHEVDRPSRSTKVNLGKMQKCCSLSCLWSQVQRDTTRKIIRYRATVTLRLLQIHQYTDSNEGGSGVTRKRQIIQYRATATLRRLQILQYTASKEGVGYKTNGNII